MRFCSMLFLVEVILPVQINHVSSFFVSDNHVYSFNAELLFILYLFKKGI